MKLFKIRRTVPLEKTAHVTKFSLPDTYVGIEIEVENVNSTFTQHILDHCSMWESHRDGSLRGGMEFVFNRPLAGVDVERAVREFCNVSNEAPSVLGITPNSSCRTGIHIHVNMQENEDTHVTLQNYIKLFWMFEHAFFGWAGEWRKLIGYCRPISEGSEESVEPFLHLTTLKDEKELLYQLKHPKLSRYHSMNVASLVKYGTVEFRLFPTVFDAELILTWVLSLLLLKKAARWFEKLGLPPEHWAKGFSFSDLVERIFPDDKVRNAISRYINEPELLDATERLKYLASGVHFGNISDAPILDGQSLLSSETVLSPKTIKKVEDSITTRAIDKFQRKFKPTIGKGNQ